MMAIKANGIQMNYELTGKKNAPVVALSHSLASSLIMWEPQMNALRADFQVLRYDIRGHGKTEAPKGAYTMEMLAEDAVALLDGLKIDVVHWVGLSMGGMIGQALALNHSSRLRSLALCDTGAIIPREGQAMWEERIGTARNQGMAALVDIRMERSFSPSFLQQSLPIVGRIREQCLATSVDGFIGCAEAIRKLNYLDRLREIKLPTLILVGADDPGTPLAASQAMHERIKNSKLIILPKARHLSNIEAAEEFTQALLQFLKSVSAF
jgi:3-oxoadipate enol-lactonase